MAAAMKMRVFPAVLLIVFFAVSAFAEEEYRGTISVYVENKASFPNQVQVRDVEAHHGLPEDCRIARKVAPLCDGDPGRELRQARRERMTCAAAVALMAEPRCSIKDLIFDDWIDPGMKVKLTVHTGMGGYGLVGVRAVNNTESWTYKPGLRDGDIIGQQ